MTEIYLFCCPGNAYGEIVDEKEIAKIYTDMAIKDYDKLITFNKNYMPFVETSDYQEVLSTKKSERKLELNVFYEQPVIRVGNIDAKLNSTSYLFNPVHSLGCDLLLPGLDVIQLEGDNSAAAADEIQRFYNKYRWDVYTHKESIEKTKTIEPINSRIFAEPLMIVEPTVLLDIARTNFGYDAGNLAFSV